MSNNYNQLNIPQANLKNMVSAQKHKKGAVASIKVLIQLFQKLAGVEGTESLIDVRRRRNTQDIRKSSFFRFLFSSLKEKRKK